MRIKLKANYTTPFITLGVISSNKVISKVSAGFLFLGWRVLYAEVIQARIHEKKINLDRAYKRLITMILS